LEKEGRIMKIAFIVSSFPTLSETFILNQITGLIDLGQDVDILAFREGRDEKVHSDVEKYKLLKRTHYFNIPKGRLRRLIRIFKVISCHFLFHPLTIIKCLNFKKYGGKYYALNNLFKMEPFLRKKYDIIHCHFGPNGNEMIFLKDIFPEIRFITTFHAYDLTVFLKGRNGVYKKLFEKGDLFLPISQLWKDRLKKMGCPEDKIMVHRMGVDTVNIKVKDRFFNDSKIRILTVARLVEKKGVEYSIKAVAEVIKRHQEVDYCIVGEGVLREKLKNLINQLNMGSKIKILGSLESDKVKKMMQSSDVFILASITSSKGDMEGIPVSLMEAMAVELPVISTYHSGIPELVVDGEFGFLVPEKDVDALAERLEYFINHPEICPEMGKAGRKFVEENFDIRKLNKKLLEIYKRAWGYAKS